jgi:hypothetical protein
MKKLLLIPVVLMTGLLAFAFLMPATAATVLRSFAPAAHLSVPSVLSAGSRTETAAKPDAGTGDAGASAPSGGSSPSRAPSSTRQGSTSQPSISIVDRGHAVATAGQVDCGRYGNGSHGGKHDLTCPNKSFPEPVN